MNTPPGPLARPATPSLRGARWLELSLDYRCNLRCLGCRACLGGDESLSPPAALLWMQRARAAGVERLWLGGGEPTLRPELPALIRAARSLGFSVVLLQTNGLRLAYPAYLRALVDAGLTCVRFNLKSHDPALHDELCASPGAHALLDQAVAAVAASPLRAEADLLLTDRTAPGVAATLRRYAPPVRALSLWLLSAHDDPPVAPRIPRIDALAPALAEAAQAASGLGVDLESLHTPWCTLPAPLRGLFRPASSWGLVVIDPSNRPLSLEGSPLEGGAYLPGCRGCSMRPRCPGPRADYLAQHGPDEFAPLSLDPTA